LTEITLRSDPGFDIAATGRSLARGGGDDRFDRVLDDVARSEPDARAEPRDQRADTQASREASPAKTGTAANDAASKEEPVPATMRRSREANAEPSAQETAETTDGASDDADLVMQDTAGVVTSVEDGNGEKAARVPLLDLLTSLTDADGAPLFADQDEASAFIDALLSGETPVKFAEVSAALSARLAAKEGAAKGVDAEAKLLAAIELFEGGRSSAVGAMDESTIAKAGKKGEAIKELLALLQKEGGDKSSSQGFGEEAGRLASAAARDGAKPAGLAARTEHPVAGGERPAGAEPSAQALERVASLFGTGRLEAAANADAGGDDKLAKFLLAAQAGEGGAKHGAGTRPIEVTPASAVGQTGAAAGLQSLTMVQTDLSQPMTLDQATLAGAAGTATAPMGAQAMTTVQTAAVASTVAVDIARFARQGETRFEIRLDPPELGRVDVRLRVADDGTVRAHLFVERSETLDLFMRDARALERALEQQGLKTGNGGLEFSLSSDGGQQASSEDAPSGGATASGEVEESDTTDRAIAQYQFRSAQDGRVDFRV